MVILVYFSRFGMFEARKIWQPCATVGNAAAVPFARAKNGSAVVLHPGRSKSVRSPLGKTLSDKFSLRKMSKDAARASGLLGHLRRRLYLHRDQRRAQNLRFPGETLLCRDSPIKVFLIPQWQRGVFKTNF
jgi:hypothetical protein